MHALSGRLSPRARRILLAVGVVLALYSLGAIVELARVAIHLTNGRDRVEAIDLDRIRADGLDGILDASAADFRAADRIASSSPFLALWKPLPVIGAQLDGVGRLTAAGATLGDEAAATGRTISAAMDNAGSSPAARLLLLDVVLEELDRVEGVAADLDLGGRGSLLWPVSGVHRSLEDSIAEVPEKLSPLRTQVQAVRTLLDGPTRYLIMGGNNAEMRAGAGMPLQIGTVTFERGDMALSDMYPATSFFFAPNPTGEYNANIAPELRATYPNWLIGKDFPETAVVPDFPRTGPLYSDLAAEPLGWQTEGEWETEGVVHIDAMALAMLLDVVGPVTIDGVDYTSETAPQLTLNQTYIDYEGVHRAYRRSAQSDLAKGIFSAIESSDFEILDLVAAFQDAAEGRHLMVWARDPVIQEMIEDLRLAGDVPPFATLVSLQNTSANKLDWYIHPTVDVEVDQVADGWDVSMTVTIPHPEREYQAQYIEGPSIGFEERAHRALLTLQVPPQATELRIVDHDVSEYGFDGESHVIGTRFVTPMGDTETVEFGYHLPPEHSAMLVMPSARVKPVPWTINGQSFNDDVPVAYSFGTFEAPLDRTGRIARIAAGLLAVFGLAFAAVALRRRIADDPPTPQLVIDVATGTALVVIAGVIAVAAGSF